MMTGYLLSLLVCFVLVGLAFGLRLSSAPSKPLGWMTMLCWGSILPASFVGHLVAMKLAFGAVGGEEIDPADKARLLAEGLAHAGSWWFFPGLALFLPGLVALVLKSRLPEPPGVQS